MPKISVNNEKPKIEIPKKPAITPSSQNIQTIQFKDKIGTESLNNNKIDTNGQTSDLNNDFQAQQEFDELTYVKIVTSDNNNNKNDNNNDNNVNNNSNNNDNNIQTMKLNSQAMNKMSIKPLSFGKNNMLFNEKDGIEKSLMKIERMDENEKFSCDYKEFDNYYPKNIESIKNEVLTIENMISKSGYISQMIIKYSYENDIPFLNEAASILIDCSGYINKENKLFNMHLICGLTEALNSIGIPYSVALISDENFKRIIKNYDTPHNKYELQKIYECYMIPRYRTNLAKSIKFAIDNLKYDSNKITEEGKINSNTAYFIFSDGMDENLFFGKEFKDILFNNINLSFGFIFIKSSLLTDKHTEVLEKLWKNFNNEISGSSSKVQIQIIENKLEYIKIREISKMFVNMLSRNINEQNYKLGN